jgi:hypothetical protein
MHLILEENYMEKSFKNVITVSGKSTYASHTRGKLHGKIIYEWHMKHNLHEA